MGECTITVLPAGYERRLYLTGLVDRGTGRYLWRRVRIEIEALTSERLRPPFRWSLPRARRAVLREARIERSEVLRRIEVDREVDARIAERERAAQDLAARSNYDCGHLRFQADRRRFGSLTTTLDGYDLPLYERALDIAIKHRLRAVPAAAE